jgi:hypothetical protein
MSEEETRFTDLPDEIKKMIMDKALLKNVESIANLQLRQDLDDRRMGLLDSATAERIRQNDPEFYGEITQRQRIYDIYEEAKVKRIATNLWITDFNNRLFRQR